ncbi:mitochondrial translation release factor 1 [Nomia melanderi]|uniref:mitochondrial translation release factor 1 n=1 Tax=Nomia melanderi TaxID=2448451 RepID=UPI0013043BC2|nr:peptide chain release factor 1-like, mitochondrial [Nomia melanderi]XP_031833963.1 peptide chain release factor 1-like, mitochondrial [Nomia melanderi]
MLFLLRGHVLNMSCSLRNTVNEVKSLESSLPALLNLNTEVPPICKNLFCTKTNLSVTDENVKRYMNYLISAYQNKNVKSQSIKEILGVQTLSHLLNEKLCILQNMNSLKDFVGNNKDMESLVKEEEAMYVQQMQDIDKQILDVILQHLDEENYNNLIIEIIPGVGGLEAMLFAHDLLNMYIGYLEYLQLDYEIIQMDNNETGGIRKAVIAVTSTQAYMKFKYEGGVHRVQRIPATERSGRMHTSTATVIILPEPSEIEIVLNKKDLKIEGKKSSGPGGQHVNSTDSAVRVTHLPTGIAVTCQIMKSQIRNKQWALMKLRSLLYEQQYEKQTSFIGGLRKKQVGKQTRNEKIRTYNYNQDRVTDHRLSNSTIHSLRTFMKGGRELEELEEKLHRSIRWKMLLELIHKADSELK